MVLRAIKAKSPFCGFIIQADEITGDIRMHCTFELCELISK